MPGVFEALTAVVGAGYGVYQAGERDRQAYRDSWRADLMYESTKKRARAEETMLQNNLTIGAMDNTSTNRDSAIAEYQNRSAQIAQAGVSGATSGTPFYKIDSDAIQNRQRLSEIEDRGRMGLEGMGLQLEAAQLSNQAQIDVAFQQKQDSAESAAYAASPFAYIMGGLTGALSGASMGAGISTLTKDVFGVTVDEAVGGVISKMTAKAKANKEALDLAKVGGTSLDSAQRRASLEWTAPIDYAASATVRQQLPGAGSSKSSYRYSDGSLAGNFSSLTPNRDVVQSTRNGLTQPRQSGLWQRFRYGDSGNAFANNNLQISSSLAEMFPGAMGYQIPTMLGLSPMTAGQGNTFGGAWSPLTQGAR